MGKSYIPKDKVYAVCTYQLSAEPQKFSNSREKPTVFYQNNEQPILTTADRNLEKPFTCKSPWNLAASFLAFGAGLIVGALLLTNPIGWILAAGAACIAIGAITTVVAAKHKCTQPLNGGEWHLVHSSVKINGQIAVTGASLLKCKTDGILTPFFSKTAAKQAAKDVLSSNRWELGLNIVGSFGAGVFLPEAFSGIGIATTITGKITAGGILTGKMGAGYVAFSTLAWAERGIIRGYHENIGELRNSKTYEDLNKVESNDLLDLPSKPDDLIQDGTDLIKPERGSDGKIKPEYLAALAAAYNSGTLVINDKNLASKLEQLSGLSKPQLRTHRLAVELLSELEANKYPNWKNNITKYNSNRMNPSMVQEGRTATAKSFNTNLKNLGKDSAKGILFFLPFVSTWFSENGRAALAKALSNDISDISLIANNPID